MLSSRGTKASLRRRELLWDVMANSYCPDLNLTGFINLGTAENCLMQAELIEHIKRNFNPPRTALSYGEGPNGSARLRSALASFFNSQPAFSPHTPVHASHISVSAGVTGSLERIAFELGDPEDAFLLGRPYYTAFPSEIGDRAGIRTIAVSFGPTVDPLSVAAVAAYEAALLDAKARGIRVRALLLCNPHNPLGRCYPRDVLEALMRLCDRHRLHIVVDEVYALSVFDPPHSHALEEDSSSNTSTSTASTSAPTGSTPNFTSALSINPSGIIDPALLHVLWGLSKDFGGNGLRIGCVVSQANPALVAALDAHAPYSYPAAFLDHVACVILEDHTFVSRYVAENRLRIAENYAVVTDWLDRFGVPFLGGTNAGLFVWADLGAAWKLRKMRGQHTNGTSDGTANGTNKNGSHGLNGVVNGTHEMNGGSNGASSKATNGTTSTSHSNGISANGTNGTVHSAWLTDQGASVDSQECRFNGNSETDVEDEIHYRLLAEKVYLVGGKEFGSEVPGCFRIVFTQPRHNLELGLARIAKALDL